MLAYIRTSYNKGVFFNTKDITKPYLADVIHSESTCISIVSQYDIFQNKPLLSGDIELNPGPVQNTNSLTRLPLHVVLEQRLRSYELRPFDVGGDGDCFFRAVSHQLYGDPEHHFEVRAAGSREIY
jgi:hypothetical protein